MVSKSHDLSHSLLHGVLIGHITMDVMHLLATAAAAAEFKDLPLSRYKVLNGSQTYARRATCDKKRTHC